jgi:hypothetical protein
MQPEPGSRLPGAEVVAGRLHKQISMCLYDAGSGQADRGRPLPYGDLRAGLPGRGYAVVWAARAGRDSPAT